MEDAVRKDVIRKDGAVHAVDSPLTAAAMVGTLLGCYAVKYVHPVRAPYVSYYTTNTYDRKNSYRRDDDTKITFCLLVYCESCTNMVQSPVPHSR
jgi:hypothetical protein